jgi:hypothetical protein
MFRPLTVFASAPLASWCFPRISYFPSPCPRGAAGEEEGLASRYYLAPSLLMEPPLVRGRRRKEGGTCDKDEEADELRKAWHGGGSRTGGSPPTGY